MFGQIGIVLAISFTHYLSHWRLSSFKIMLSWHLLGNSQDCIPHFHILHQPVSACLHVLQSQWLTFIDSLNFHVGMRKQRERRKLSLPFLHSCWF